MKKHNVIGKNKINLKSSQYFNKSLLQKKYFILNNIKSKAYTLLLEFKWC
jgi:hypothetical protein